jgi:hypothetical protein
VVTDGPSARRPDASEAIATQARLLDGWVVPPILLLGETVVVARAGGLRP